MTEPISPGVHCPSCGSGRTSVRDTRPRDHVIWRKRRCRACGENFSTYEFTEAEVPSMQRRPRDAIQTLRAMALRIVAHADESLRDE
jgi:transcriptional regulator NrdR family protein